MSLEECYFYDYVHFEHCAGRWARWARWTQWTEDRAQRLSWLLNFMLNEKTSEILVLSTTDYLEGWAGQTQVLSVIDTEQMTYATAIWVRWTTSLH